MPAGCRGRQQGAGPRGWGQGMDLEEQRRLIGEAQAFDAEWYCRRYRDVPITGIEPLEHFLRYGRLLRRSPSAGFDSRFYLETYSDAAESPLNPLVHYLTRGLRDGRPTSRAALRSEWEALRRATEVAWLGAEVTGPRPVISYCIPVMNRLDDIRGTLRENLEANARFTGRVEFVLVIFDRTPEAMDWVQANCAEAIASGLLRVVADRSLDSWHFCKAKNAFRALIRGEIYSSLDGDNFVTAEETEALLEVHAAHEGYFLAHHFTGSWGDGTSGRVSLPAPAYRAVGYEPRLLPRQFDEVDLILGVLKRFPAMPFLRVDARANLLTRSAYARDFFEGEGMPNRLLLLPPCRRRPPLNPRGEGYTTEAPHLRAMQDFNAAFSGYTRSSDPARREAYLEKLMRDRQRVIDELPGPALVEMLFADRGRPTLPLLGRGRLAAFLCLRNEEGFLPALLAHYRALGVTDFFAVDDGSDRPLEEALPEPDLHVFHPKVGTFRTAKTLWLEALIKAHVPEGGWFLTIDADEFIAMPPGIADFPALARALEAKGREFCPALLLDLLPDPEAGIAALGAAEGRFQALFTRVLDRRGPPSADYRAHRSIAWGFGPAAELSWRFDARHHLFGTFDSLRKIPFLRHRPRRHLNQGFHTLHNTDRTPSPGTEIWAEGPILPILHYKLVKLTSEEARARMLEQAGAYHARTGENLRQIFSTEAAGALELLLRAGREGRPVAEVLAEGIAAQGVAA